MEVSVKERLKEFIKAEGISEREFCRRVGVGSAYIQSIRKSIMPDTLQQITIQFPRLNPLWLLLGEGEMFIPETKPLKSGRRKCLQNSWTKLRTKKPGFFLSSKVNSE